MVDDEDFDSLSAFKWCARKAATGFCWYACRKTRAHEKEIGMPGVITMHRQIMGFPPQPIDHRNRIGLDNRRSNLRLCTHQQNAANRLVRQGASGFRGVYAEGRRWKSAISYHNRDIYLGTFDTPLDAALAYDVAAREMHGEFAILNFGSK